MTQEREDYMRRQEAEHEMIRMRQPMRQFSPHPDPRDEIIADLVTALEDFDNWFCGFDPDDRHSRMQGRQVIIRARAIIAKARPENPSSDQVQA